MLLKRAIPIITFSKPDEHSEQLFKALEIRKPPLKRFFYEDFNSVYLILRRVINAEQIACLLTE